MQLHAMHHPRVLAAVARLSAPPLCEWMAAPLANPGQPLGCFATGNLLSPDFAFDAMLPGDWIFAWSGTLAADLAEGSPDNWIRGPAVLGAACESLGPQLARHGRRLLLVPHARHVLSDARSALTWWCEHVTPGQELTKDTRAPAGERPFGLAFDPAALLEPSMVEDVEDHMRSLFGAIGPRADAVILRGVRPVADAAVRGADPDAAEALESCALADGVIPIALVRELLAMHVAPGTPVLVPGAGLEFAQRALTGAQ